MRTERLTDTKAKALKAAAGKRRMIGDPECPGLFVRVTGAGHKTYLIVAQDPYTKKRIWREVRGVAFGLHTLEEVRPLAREAIKRLKEGKDPFPPAPPAPDTFKSVAENWIKRYVDAQGLISKPEIERRLKVYVYPAWERRIFTEVTRGDVTRLLDSIEDKHGKRQADAVLADIRGIMNWYEGRGECDDYRSPIGKKMRRGKLKKRDRILSDEELRLIWPVWSAAGQFGAFCKLAVLTLQRRGKLVAIDRAGALAGRWIVPTAPREKGNAGELLLPSLAVEIAKEQPEIVGNPYLFPGRRHGQHMNSFSAAKLDIDAKIAAAAAAQELPVPAPWVIHDLRRTGRSLLSRAGVDREIAERVMGHVIPGVEGVYDRHAYTAEKADALKRLAALIEIILAGPQNNVVELRVG